MTSIIILLFLATLVWFWIDSINAKEKAMQASAHACKQIQAQFLDQTASLKRIRFSRNNKGKLVLERTYNFDFSRDHENRSKGLVMINGQVVTKVMLDEESGTTIL